MAEFVHQRHKPPTPLAAPRELVIACPRLHSNVNLARIVRAAGCCGVRKMIVCGKPRLDRDIARDALDVVELESHRTLPPALAAWRKAGYRIVGLEQAELSQRLYDYRFQRKTVLVVGHERQGLDDDALAALDDVVEIPVYGAPLSHNVATATAMAMYEYCRQHPEG
jgi:tRNA G18 (ribose-2'-O)-methylase SpoU